MKIKYKEAMTKKIIEPVPSQLASFICMLWLRVYDAFLLKETRKIAQTIRSKFNFQVLQFIYFYFCKSLKQYLMPPKTY